MQEYQSSATEAEIKCTKENTRFLQLEMTFEAEKRRLVNKQSEDAKQLEVNRSLNFVNKAFTWFLT